LLRRRQLQRLVVDHHLVLPRVDQDRKLGDDLPVHRDAALADHLFHVAAGRDSGVAEDLLNAFFHTNQYAPKPPKAVAPVLPATGATGRGTPRPDYGHRRVTGLRVPRPV